MGKQIAGILVTFEKSVHEDYAKDVMKAISMIHGVGKAELQPLDGQWDFVMARNQVKREIAQKLFDILKD